MDGVAVRDQASRQVGDICLATSAGWQDAFITERDFHLGFTRSVCLTIENLEQALEFVKPGGHWANSQITRTFSSNELSIESRFHDEMPCVILWARLGQADFAVSACARIDIY